MCYGMFITNQCAHFSGMRCFDPKRVEEPVSEVVENFSAT